MQSAKELFLHALKSMLQALQLLCCILRRCALSGTSLMDTKEQKVATRAPADCL